MDCKIDLENIKEYFRAGYELSDEAVSVLIAEVERLQKFADDMNRTANGAFLDGRKNAEGEFEAERAQIRADLAAAQSRIAEAEGEVEKLRAEVSALYARLIADDHILRWENTEFAARLNQRGAKILELEEECKRLKG